MTVVLLTCDSTLELSTFQEGSFTVLYGLVCFVIMPRSLSTIPLLTPEERSNAEALLIQEHTMLEKDGHFSWSSTLGALFQPHVLLYFVMGFFGGMGGPKY